MIHLKKASILAALLGAFLSASGQPTVPEATPAFTGGSLDVEGLVAGPIDGQDSWAYTADGATRLPSEGVAVTAGGLDWEATDGGVIAAGTQHLYTQAGLVGNGKMDRWMSYSPVSISGPAYVRFVALLETRPEGSPIAAGDPYELFFGLTDNAAIDGAPWNAYVALKYPANGEGVGVETTGSGGVLPSAEVALDSVLLVVAKYETDVDGKLTAIKVWLNPDEADEASPDHTITLAAPGVVLADQDHLKLRMQNMPARIDHLLVASSWAEVVPEAFVPPFKLLANQFEDLTAGPVNGRDGWSAPAGVSVSASAFSFTTADALVWSGGDHALELNGSTATPINSWALRGIDTEVPDETFYVSYRASISDNSTADPSELFIRNASWGIFSALKVTDDIFEVNGQQYTEAGLLYDTPVHVVLEATVSGGVVTTVKGWLNPVLDADLGTNGQQQPSPDITVEGLTVALDSISGFEVRSQKARSVVDDLVMTEKWIECFNLRQVHIAAVADLGMNYQFEGQEDLAIGEGLSPHDPADEPPSIDSVPFVDFQNALTAAFDKGLGGVADFERANVTVTSGLEWAAEVVSITQINAMTLSLGQRDVRVTLGRNAHVEGGCAEGYTGKECPNPDFLNPAPSVEDGYGLWSIGTNNKASSGTSSLGGFNSYDFDFDPADKLVMVSITFINWENFQSYQRTWMDKPNVRARATFTNGSDDVVLLSTGFTAQVAEPFNTFFGFEAPQAGYYLKRLEVFTKGNTGRVWAGLDDLAVVAEAPDLYTFTFNNEGQPDGADRPIQAGEWDGIYSSAALPLVTGDAVFADLSEGVTDDTTPGSYKAGFLFVSGKNEQPAPEGFMVWSTNTGVTSDPQTPFDGVNPQTQWFTESTGLVTNLKQLPLEALRDLQMRIRPRNAGAVRYHFAIQVEGEWYVSEQAFQHSGVGDGWESVSLSVPGAAWLSGVVGSGSLNLDFTAAAPTSVTIADIGGDKLLDTVGIYIDTDDNIGTADTWARIDSITLEAIAPVIDAPTITAQPQAVAVVEGDTAEFSVSVLETEGISFQWRKDGADLSGEVASTLTLANVLLADAGDYDVVVTGPGGIAISDKASLTVYAAPVVSPVLIEAGPVASSEFITVTADSAVSWTSVSDSDWITVTLGASGSGSDLVGIDIAANGGFAARSGSVTIAGQVVTVNQVGGTSDNFDEVVGGVDQLDGTILSPWFGLYSPIAGTEWVLHSEQGYFFVESATSPDGMYLWSLALRSWVWTSQEMYPIVYEMSGGRFVFHVEVLVETTLGGTTGEVLRLFIYDYETGTWDGLE